MILLSAAAMVAVVFLLAGLAVWLSLRLAGRKRGRTVARWTAISYLLFLPLFLFVALPLIFSQMIAAASTRPMDLRDRSTPADCGSSFQNVTFESRDGVRLEGWFLQEGDRIPIVFGHGLFRSRREVLKRSCDLNQMGYPVLLFDFRRHGSSGDRPITMGCNERYDMLGAVEFLASRGYSRSVLAGVSMGAVSAILAAAEDSSGVAAVVADSPFDSLTGTIRHHVGLLLGIPAAPFADIFTWNLGRVGDFSPSRCDTLAGLETVDRPVLLLYGAADSRMPEEVARKLYQAVFADQKDLVFFEEATHGRAYHSDGRRFVAVVDGFLQGLGRRE